MNNQKLTEIVSKYLNKYEGQQIILSKLKDELNDAFNQYITENDVIKEDFPVTKMNMENGKYIRMVM